jgi:hypothetical protein
MINKEITSWTQPVGPEIKGDKKGDSERKVSKYLDNEILFGILSHSFNHNFAFNLLISYFTIIKIPLEIDGKATTSASSWPPRILKLLYLSY